MRRAQAAPDLAGRPQLQRYLAEALDALADGMPGDHVALILYAALGVALEG